MAGTVLETRLSAVARRLHRLRILRRQAVCWLIVLVPAIILCSLMPESGLPLRRESLTLIAACILGLVLARWKTHGPTWLETARLLEQQNPELKDVVLTAVRQQSGDSNTSPVLAARVMCEADNLALTVDWRSVVSGRQIFKWFTASLATFGLLVTAVFAAGRMTVPGSTNGGDPQTLTSESEIENSVSVEPGDVEIERGTSLAVVARFSGSVPLHAVVEFRKDTAPNPNAEGTVRPRKDTTVHEMDLTVDDGVFAVRIPAIDRDGSYVVVYGNEESAAAGHRATSEAYWVSTYVRPHVVRVDAVIDPPEWSHRSSSTVEDTLRVVAIEGSRVTLRLHVNKPVSDSRLDSKGGDSVPLTADGPLAVQAVVDADQDDTWTVFLEDERGRTAGEKTRISQRIIRNEPPEIRITFPQPDLSVSALQEVVTEAEAVDDFGIVDFGIAYSLSGAEPQRISLRTDNEPITDHVAIDHTIVLESLHVEESDLLTWHFYADTYNAAGEVQRSLSDLMFADVRRFEEIFRQSQQQNGQGQQQSGGSTDNLLQIQRQIAIAIWNLQQSLSSSAARPNRVAADEVGTIRESQEVALAQLGGIRQRADGDLEMLDAVDAAEVDMNDVVNALAAWSDETPEPALTDASVSAQSAFQRLLRLRAAEHDVQRSRSQRGGGFGRNSAMQQQLDQLELDSDGNRYETEREAQQNQQAEEQREQLQILNQLRELARRQNLLNERLRQLESELWNAKSKDDRDGIERELKRLRDEQREMLRDVDELRERMDQSSSRNQPEQQQIRQEVDQARDNVRQASRAMDAGQLSEALSEGTRAERQFGRLQEKFRNQTSSAFEEASRALRQRARELSERQQQIARQLEGEAGASSQPDKPKGGRQTSEQRSAPPSLRSDRNDDEVQEQLRRQRDDLNRILDQSRQLVEESEESEPLLARRLYETVRRVQEMNTDEALRAAEILLGRGLRNQVAEPEQAARRGIEALREGVEQAADAVLGSEKESLRHAQQTLEQLSEQLSEEVEAATRQPTTHSASGDNASNEPREGIAARGQQPAVDDSGQNRQQATERQSGRRQWSILQGGRRESGGSSSVMHRPLTGDAYRDWSDRMREVEEILDDPELRNRVAQVRDRARSMRAEFRRHGTEPQWDIVKSDLLREMQSLQRRLAEDIAALQSDRSMVPIDREPVPEEFDELVQRYYELLGQQRQESRR